MRVDISNKVVVITGASKGIGRELARTFATEKAKIVINYNRSEKEALDLYNEISQICKESIIVKADIADEYEVENMYNVVIEKFGRIDILINNAGIKCDEHISDISALSWKKVIDVNLTGTFLCSSIFSRAMIKQRSGKIINIASIKGQIGGEDQISYSSSKAGVIGLTKSFAKDLGEFNISVNAVCPGFIETNLNKSDQQKQNNAKLSSLLSIETALDDLVKFMIFLSSDAMLGVSGRIFNIDSRLF